MGCLELQNRECAIEPLLVSLESITRAGVRVLVGGSARSSAHRQAVEGLVAAPAAPTATAVLTSLIRSKTNLLDRHHRASSPPG